MRYKTLETHVGYSEEGIASWYGKKFHGKLTSTREIYNMYELTAAHKSLPIPCYVEVTNLINKKTIIVRVNDRGPFKKGRIIDLSYAAAKKLDIIEKGTAKVQINEKEEFLSKNESTYIPLGSKHRLSNPGKSSLVLIEVQSGDYLGEDDIIRFEDNYGRE